MSSLSRRFLQNSPTQAPTLHNLRFPCEQDHRLLVLFHGKNLLPSEGLHFIKGAALVRTIASIFSSLPINHRFLTAF
jgi:hypothetical protein